MLVNSLPVLAQSAQVPAVSSTLSQAEPALSAAPTTSPLRPLAVRLGMAPNAVAQSGTGFPSTVPRTATQGAPSQGAPSQAAPSQGAANQGAANQGTATGQKRKKKKVETLPEVDYWIDPDRPHIADSSVNVPKGLWLQENGFQESYLNRKNSTFDFPETLIRQGVTNRTELRYNVPNFFASSITAQDEFMQDDTTRTAGLQNMQAGFKQRLGPIGPTKFQIAVNPFITIPSGFGHGASTRVDPSIKIPFSQEINEHWDIEGMECIFLPTVNGSYDMDWQNDLVLNRMWGRQANAFIEYSGDKFSRGTMSNIIHFGAAYRPNRRMQMDTQFGFRMNNAAPIAFFGFGYSFLLGNLNTPRLTPSKFRTK